MPPRSAIRRLALDQRRSWQSARPSSGAASAVARLRQRSVANGATRREQAAGRPVELAGDDAGDRGQHAPGRPLRQGREQRVACRDDADRAKSGCVWLVSTCWPAYWTIDAMRGLGHDAHVVGDEHEAHAGFLTQPQQEIEDLRLDRHVERRRRLVGDQQLRPAGDRHRDHHALAHSAGQAGAGTADSRRSGSVMPTSSSNSTARRLRAALSSFEMGLQRLADLEADREARVQRRHRLLEDHRDIAPDDAAALSRRDPEHVAAVEAHDDRRSPSRSRAAGPSRRASRPTCRSRTRRRWRRTSFWSTLRSTPSTALKGPLRVLNETDRLRISRRLIVSSSSASDRARRAGRRPSH